MSCNDRSRQPFLWWHNAKRILRNTLQHSKMQHTALQTISWHNTAPELAGHWQFISKDSKAPMKSGSRPSAFQSCQKAPNVQFLLCREQQLCVWSGTSWLLGLLIEAFQPDRKWNSSLDLKSRPEQIRMLSFPQLFVSDSVTVAFRFYRMHFLSTMVAQTRLLYCEVYSHAQHQCHSQK